MGECKGEYGRVCRRESERETGRGELRDRRPILNIGDPSFIERAHTSRSAELDPVGKLGKRERRVETFRDGFLQMLQLQLFEELRGGGQRRHLSTSFYLSRAP